MRGSDNLARRLASQLRARGNSRSQSGTKYSDSLRLLAAACTVNQVRAAASFVMLVRLDRPYHIVHYFRDLKRQIRRYSIPHLHVLLCSISFKEIIVGECLQSRSLANCQAPVLSRVVVNIVVAIFGNMTGHRAAWHAGCLNLEPVCKFPRLPVCVIGSQRFWEIVGAR